MKQDCQRNSAGHSIIAAPNIVCFYVFIIAYRPASFLTLQGLKHKIPISIHVKTIKTPY